MAQIVTATRPVDELGGPIRIAKAAGEASYSGWVGILNLVIALSVVLGVFNLLPVPMLDGGHLAMYLYEAVRGKPLGLKAQELGCGWVSPSSSAWRWSRRSTTSSSCCDDLTRCMGEAAHRGNVARIGGQKGWLT